MKSACIPSLSVDFLVVVEVESGMLPPVIWLRNFVLTFLLKYTYPIMKDTAGIMLMVCQNIRGQNYMRS